MRNGNPIRVGIAGINHAAHCTTYEGERPFATDERKHKHPIDEAAEAMERLRNGAAAAFDEFLIQRFEATNEPPYRFSWIDERATELDYGAVLARIAQSYEAPFRALRDFGPTSPKVATPVIETARVADAGHRDAVSSASGYRPDRRAARAG